MTFIGEVATLRLERRLRSRGLWVCWTVLVTEPERDLPPTLDGVGVGIRASSTSIVISRSSMSLSSAMGEAARAWFGEEGNKPGDDGRRPGDEGGVRALFGYKLGGARRPDEKKADYVEVIVRKEKKLDDFLFIN